MRRRGAVVFVLAVAAVLAGLAALALPARNEIPARRGARFRKLDAATAQHAGEIRQLTLDLREMRDELANRGLLLPKSMTTRGLATRPPR